MKKLALLKISSLAIALLVLLPGLAVLSGCDVVTGSGETSSFEMAYSDFSRLEIATGFDVEISRADEFFVGITVDKALYEYISIAQRGDTLHIGLKTNHIYTAADRQAVVRLPDLRRLELSGGSKALLAGFSVTHAMDFELSGASSIIIEPTIAGDVAFVLSGGSDASGRIAMNNGNFDLSGGSKLEIKGTAAGISIDASGESVVNLPELPAPEADIKLSGSSRALVNVSDIMSVYLSGGSSLEYIGSPKLGRMEMSGGSILNQKQP